jgi:hypothetical protein
MVFMVFMVDQLLASDGRASVVDWSATGQL